MREAEARAVRTIVENRFPKPETERWMILGDFNEPSMGNENKTTALTPLKPGFSEDLLDRLPRGTDWTFEVPDTHIHSRPDRIFLSTRLAREQTMRHVDLYAIRPQLLCPLSRQYKIIFDL